MREVALAAGARGLRCRPPLRRGRRGRGGAGPRRVGRGAGGRARLPLPGPPTPRPAGADRGHRHAHLRCGRRRLLTAGEAAIGGHRRLGYGRVPVCMAKTQSSLSHDPALKGRPRGFLAAGPRRSPVRRCGVRDRVLRRHAHDAGTAAASGRRAGGHRRRGPHHRPLLARPSPLRRRWRPRVR